MISSNPDFPRFLGTVWDTKTEQCLRFINNEEKWIKSVEWSPNGKKIVVGTWTGKLHIWDTNDWKTLFTINAHFKIVNGVSWSPDSTKFFSISEDRTLRIWDGRTGKCFLTVEIDGKCESASWSPYGNSIVTVSSEKTMRIWNFLYTKDSIVLLTQKDKFFGINHKVIHDSDFQALARHAVESQEWYALTDRSIELGLI